MTTPVTVVTDTTAYLPRETVDKHGLRVISLYYSFGNDEWIKESDHDGGDWGSFYERLSSSDTLPTTQPPTVEDFRAVYEPLLAEGGSVVSIHLSSVLSETCANARKAVEELTEASRGGDRVRVIDSASTAVQEGLLALAAAHAAGEGKDADSVTEVIRSARAEAKNWFVLDTLEYLKRGGRIGGATAWMGSALQVKPVLTLESGIRAVERVRTADKAFVRLVEYGHQLHGAGADAWAVQHSRREDDARKLIDRLSHVFGRAPEFVSEVGPVIGTHAGPGAFGLGGIPSRFLG